MAGNSNVGSHNEWDSIWKDQKDNLEASNQFNPNGKYENIFQFWQHIYASDLIRLIKGRDYQNFLELGAGKGTTSMYLRYAGYQNISLVDLSPRAPEFCRHLFNFNNLGSVNYFISNVENTGLDSSSYDCIYNIGLLEHFENPKPTLAEAFRLLRSGGMIFMPIVPEQHFMKSALCRAILNPLSLIKYFIKRLITPSTEKPKSAMVRTDHGPDFYRKACEELGYVNVRCIPYNPYWKVNSNIRIEKNLSVFLYNIHYKLFKQQKLPSFATWSLTNVCYLLTAEKV